MVVVRELFSRVIVVVVRELFYHVTSAICVWKEVTAGQRLRGRLPHGSCFRLLLHSYHIGFVGTISTLFCYVNIKLILFFVD